MTPVALFKDAEVVLKMLVGLFFFFFLFFRSIDLQSNMDVNLT